VGFLNVINPTRLDFQVFSVEGLDVEKYFHNAKLLPLQTLEPCFIPKHMKDFYKNLKSVDENLIIDVYGYSICFNPKLLAQLLGLPYDKKLLPPTESVEFYLKNALGKNSVSSS
jgi:hypothetical protein